MTHTVVVNRSSSRTSSVGVTGIPGQPGATGPAGVVSATDPLTLVAGVVGVDAAKLAEIIRDAVGGALVAGTNVTITVDDDADTITVSAAGGGGGTTSEEVQDIVGAMATDTTTIDFVYDDNAGTITAAIKVGSIGASLLSFDPATQAEIDAHTSATGAAVHGLGTAATHAAGDFDAAGAATGAVASHEAAPDPHPQYLTSAEGNAAYDTAGSATSAMSAHTGASDPHAQYQRESEKGAANGYASLDAGGKVPTGQLPALAITSTYVVASQVAMLALTAEEGDVAVRTDLSKSFILRGNNPTLLSDWQELLTPTDVVQSVNGHVGAVTGLLEASNNLNDVGSAATARTNLGLGAAATLDVGTTAGTVAAGDDSRLSDARTPTGSAGGVLSGTYPNPGFAADMATQAELDAHTGGTDPHGDRAWASSQFQPLDSDLTAIAALSTTTFGRSLLALADAAAGRTALGLGSLATLSTITTTEITDGTIVNADISASAAIALSKLAQPAQAAIAMTAWSLYA